MSGCTGLRFPDALTPETFLKGFWQKRPLFIPGALDCIEPSLDPGELAWLATQDDVESRLIFTGTHGGHAGYRVMHGPFEEETLSSLPEKNWTLLVHDVEKHLPEFRALFAGVDFIPDWRIDDLMVSVAAPGGGAGPHTDNYDVFLCQGKGSREWRLGKEDDGIQSALSNELSLLKPFVDESPRTASNGDVYYLPPGAPHWGIARESCMTYSIGMRAPSLAELKGAAARSFDMNAPNMPVTSPGDEEVFYEDADLSIEEAVPGLISATAVNRVNKMLRDIVMLDESRLATVLGCVATEVKPWIEPECLSPDEAKDIIATLDRDSTVSVHGMARIAWSRAGGLPQIFANGRSKSVSADCLGMFRDLCRRRSATSTELCPDGDTDLLKWLHVNGVVDLTQSSR